MRILLFLLTNIAVVAVLYVVLWLFGFDSYMARTGGGANSQGLLIFAAVFGFGGALISLFMSKFMAKRSMGVKVIDNPANSQEHWLVDTVARQAKEAGIGMPEVGIFPSQDVNAFATGANKNNALVAVSSGLLDVMSKQEAEAVIGHEVSHVANGDMVTMTLIQGVVNTFVIFFARVIGGIIDRVVFRNERGHGIGFFISTMIAQMVLGVLASIIVMWFSRLREFRADKGGANLAGRTSMIKALERLKQVHNEPAMPEQMVAFGIRGGNLSGFRKLFMSHPPLGERIRALQEYR